MTSYPPTRLYRTRVSRVHRLTPHFTRITLRDEDLRHFGTAGLDQRIKLLFPPEGGALDLALFDAPIGEWYPKWRLLPNDERGTMRTYTVRAIRPQEREIDIDFVLHGVEGPASAWADGAEAGDELLVLGPDARSETSGGGVEWKPGAARTVLLAGDETAAPAIGAILESLDRAFTGSAFIEVPTSADALDFELRADVEVEWLPRDGAEHGSLLDAAVRARAGAFRGGRAQLELADPDPEAILWEVPEHDASAEFYAWLAGEAGAITGLRRHLVKELGIDRRSVAFMGYWRRGRAEAN